MMQRMKQNDFNLIAGAIIMLAATLHFVRSVNGWGLVLNGWDVPVGISWIAVIIGWYVALQGFRLGRK